MNMQLTISASSGSALYSCTKSFTHSLPSNSAASLRGVAPACIVDVHAVQYRTLWCAGTILKECTTEGMQRHEIIYLAC